jgi:hypothetical protein
MSTQRLDALAYDTAVTAFVVVEAAQKVHWPGSEFYEIRIRQSSWNDLCLSVGAFREEADRTVEEAHGKQVHPQGYRQPGIEAEDLASP